MRHRTAVLVIVAMIAAACAVRRVKAPGPPSAEYTVPVTVPDSDVICVETITAYRPCRTVREFRLWMLSARAE